MAQVTEEEDQDLSLSLIKAETPEQLQLWWQTWYSIFLSLSILIFTT